jgi:molecular chaperone GrpE
MNNYRRSVMTKDKKNSDQEEQINDSEQVQDISGTEEEIMNKDKKIEELENEVADLKDKLLRRAAEFENYKRRTENDQLNLLKYAAETFIIKLLPVIDDFERSLQHIDNSSDVESIKKGLKLIYDKLMKVLDEQGVKKIESVGQPFDVDFHEALMQRKAEEVAPHTVLDEIEKGYMYKDRVIRHAKVVVSEEQEDQEENDNSANENKQD